MKRAARRHHAPEPPMQDHQQMKNTPDAAAAAMHTLAPAPGEITGWTVDGQLLVTVTRKGVHQ